MDEKTLIAFIERIIHNCGGDTGKMSYSLSQLRTIVTEQQTSAKLIDIVTKASQNAPELVQYVGKTHIDARDLENAEWRAQQRRKREQELRDRGRC